ncbi:MAG: cyclic nucleotide-binding domain-containing protein [Gammaproteobacteria bacterium]|nr:cyclic nucleotide-binding domain-containing protein [Gammaproteobacteria bacterium]
MSAQESEFIVDTNVILNSPLGHELTAEQSGKLAEVVSARCLEKGMFLLEEGHKDNSLFVVSGGELEVVKATGGGDWVTLQVLRPGDLAGEMGFIDGAGHSAAIRSLGYSEVFSLERSDLERLLDEDPQLVYHVMRAIMRTVHSIMRRMNLQLIEMTNYVTKEHGRY